MLISLRSVNYAVGGFTLLDDASMVVNAGEKIAIIGRNGSGKSTLLNLLQGELSLDAGRRDVAKKCRILLVKQNLPSLEVSPIEFLKEEDEELQELYTAMEGAEESDIERLYDEINLIEEDRYEKRAPQVLMGLGITEEQQKRPMKELSGGLRMRIGLASALLQKPDVLLLDEPTNHLDLPSSIWLTEYLKSYDRAFVLVSHDRALLDAVINTTYHLSNGKLTRYNGDFTIYVEQSNLAKEQAILNNISTDQRVAEIQAFVDTHKSNPKWARICRTREGWIDNLEENRLDLVHEAPPIPIDFPECSELGDPIIQALSCRVGYADKVILNDVNLSLQSRSRVGILGRNGEGKSTLVRMLVGHGVTKTGELISNARLRIGYFSQEQTDILNPDLSVLEQQKLGMSPSLTNEDVLTHLLRFGFKREQCGTLVRDLSGGEKTRLSFAMIAANKPHLIIMDEPTNHLDFETREMLIEAINSFNGAVVLVSHDWELLNKTMREFWLVKDSVVRPYPHNLTHYRAKILERTFATSEKPAKKAAASEMDTPKKGAKSEKVTKSEKAATAATSSLTLFSSQNVFVKVKAKTKEASASALSGKMSGK